MTSDGEQRSADRDLTVMVVEDEFLLALDVELILTRHGYRVVGPATSVRAALRLLEGEMPDVAVLDVSLNGEWVTPVADVLRQAGIPYVVMSAFGKSEIEPTGLLHGTQNIGKPVIERRLVSALADAVSQNG